ncbi:MAG: MlaD family protein [Candidatus Azobacteroides sp.]|nr:MlaD family protein [Candidatus Azobacteroides sp.]
MKKYFSKEIIIGLVTLLSLGLLYFGLNYLKGSNIFKPANLYYVRMPDVSELQLSNPVYVDGFKVGLVRAINYDYFKDSGNIVVQISLDKKMKVETGSQIEIKTGLTSGAYLNLRLNKYVSTYYQPNDTIDGLSEKGMMEKVSDNILPRFETMLPRLDSILQGIQYLVNHPALAQSLEQLSATTANLETSTRQLSLLLSKDIPPIVANLNQASSDFTVVSSQFKQMDLSATMHRVDELVQNLDKITGQFNSKDNSMGLLLNDRSVYDHLDTTFINASNLLLDLKLNPKRYVHFSVFGKK